jgi:hypothetical protein
MSGENARAARLERKAAAVEAAAEGILVTTGRLATGPVRRYLALLYDAAEADGFEHGCAQAVSGLPPPEDYHIVPLPASVHDRHGHPIGEPVTSDAMRWDAAYPLTALCSTCQQPVRCETAESPWTHSSDG